jgi:glycosyltransferase involved in cell wall biosynthesis
MTAEVTEFCPPVSVLVCTRNRPDDLVMALPGIMAQDYPCYEVVLIDQSTNDESEQRVKAQFGHDPRLRYIRTPTVGLSIARNMALTEARQEICAFTDDDCVVPSRWLANIVATYRAFPETHILFSPVHAPADMMHREDLRFPSLYFDEARVLRRREILGMGANMSMRKSFWQQVGPFDPMLGPGAPMPGSDEHDWLYRAHLNDAIIRLEPTNVIEHRAWRTFDEWMRLTATYSYGDGAFAMKHLRCGDFGVLPLIASRLLYIGARGVLRFFQRGSWHYEYNYVTGYWKGLWGSRKFPVDKKARLFGPASPSPPGSAQDAGLKMQDAAGSQGAASSAPTRERGEREIENSRPAREQVGQ